MFWRPSGCKKVASPRVSLLFLQPEGLQNNFWKKCPMVNCGLKMSSHCKKLQRKISKKLGEDRFGVFWNSYINAWTKLIWTFIFYKKKCFVRARHLQSTVNNGPLFPKNVLEAFRLQKSRLTLGEATFLQPEGL